MPSVTSQDLWSATGERWRDWWRRAILAFFGAPEAHEDDPQRAILAGLDIVGGIALFREEIKNEYGLGFNVRVGIITGPVVIGEVGADFAGEYTAMATRSTWPLGWNKQRNQAPCRSRRTPRP